VLLPTGHGKSIAYQLAAMLRPGSCIVIDPIISIIDDQLDNLKSVGIDRCIGISSQIKDTETKNLLIDQFASGHYLFCFVAPERFQMESFRNALRVLTVASPISLVAVDEAHCVSEWGHDFRTAYLNLGRIARDYCSSDGIAPPIVALTGTASRIVLKDVQRELGILEYDAVITPRSFDRPELNFEVYTSSSEEKAHRVIGLLNAIPQKFGLDRMTFFRARGADTTSGMVFCPHAGGNYGVKEYATRLGKAIGSPVEFYSGRPPKGIPAFNWDHRKRSVAANFKRNVTSLLTCTKAFGMGIDKPNVRYTVHTSLPASIESFYQEAGRAGRDRATAHCAIVVSNDDEKRTQVLLDPNTPVSTVAKIVEAAGFESADDITRALYFHVNSFKGKAEELDDASALITRVGRLDTRRNVSISWKGVPSSKDTDDGKSRFEKVLHRLVLLGVVSDYTLNYGSMEFTIKLSGAGQEEMADALGNFVGGYQLALVRDYRGRVMALPQNDHNALVLGGLSIIADFIYETIEKARRRSLQEMLNAAVANKGGNLRKRILDYLQTSEYDSLLDEVVTNPGDGGLSKVGAVFDLIISPLEAAGVRGAAGSYLTSYPDVPGLLLVRGVAEALSKDSDETAIVQNIQAAVASALGSYHVPARAVANALGLALATVIHKPGMHQVVQHAVLSTPNLDRDCVRELIQLLPMSSAVVLASWLVERLVEDSQRIRKMRRLVA
jgi:ATP-dependent DNA helicase RecQ